MGLVVDSVGRKPISFANVIVLGTKIGTQTDERGMFRLVMPDTGVFRIQVQPLGYERRIQGVTVRAGRVDTIEIRMRWDTRLKQPYILWGDTSKTGKP